MSKIKELKERIERLEALLRRCQGNLYHPFEPHLITVLEREIEIALRDGKQDAPLKTGVQNE